VSSVPSWHVVAPFPLGHIPVKAGCMPSGAAASVTVTPLAAPFCTQACTVNEAVWPT
jgi:hypothetical protein